MNKRIKKKKAVKKRKFTCILVHADVPSKNLTLIRSNLWYSMINNFNQNKKEEVYHGQEKL